MNTKEDIIKKYKKYVLKKSVYSALSFISLYSIAILLTSLTPISFDMVFLKNKNDPWNSFALSTRETVKAIYDFVPLKDNILTALGALVLTLFINVQSENKEINRKSGHEVAKARAYKTFSDIIIIYILGPIMFINFWAKILLSDTINSNDQTAPWVSLFFMFFILMVRSLEGDSVDSVRKQILQAESRKSVINVHARNPINPKDKKYNDVLYRYEHSEPFFDPTRKVFGYIKLKYNIKNILPRVSFQFLFILCLFYTTLSITRIPYLPLMGQEYTLIQYSIHVFHQAPYIIPEDIIRVSISSIATSLILILFDIGYQIFSNLLNIHSEKNLYGYTLKIIYWILVGFIELGLLTSILLSIISSGTYAFLELPLYIYTITSLICTIIILIIGYIIIGNDLNRNYTQKLNQRLDLPKDQSLNETKTSAELYYLNTKLESLDKILKTLLEETQDSYTQWKNSSNINSDNINSSCE